MKYILLLLTVLLPLATMNAQDKPAAKLSGYMFGDYFYNVTRDTAIGSLSNAAMSGAKDFNGFQFRRIYLTYDGDISSALTSRFRIEGTTAAPPFIKDAYIKWKNIFGGSDLIFGFQPMPAVEISESIWEYRSLEKTILDLHGVVSSRDLAVSLRGKVDEQGIVGYWVALGNNSGTGVETDKYKRLYASINLKPAEKAQFALYGDYKMKSSINDPRSTAAPPATLGNNSFTGALFAGYNEKNLFTLGMIGFYQSLVNGSIPAAAPIIISDKNSVGLSLFGSYFVAENLNLVGRYDYFDSNSDGSAKGDSRNYFLAGADFRVDKNFSVIPNIQLETYESIPTGAGNRSVDASITARITLFYTFL